MTHIAKIVFFATLLLLGNAAALQCAETPPASDWPQFRGPNRDGIALNCPKLLDSWPKEGPKLAWKSEWIPGFHGGGCGGPVVAGGKVFLYANVKQPLGGGTVYKLITPEVLANAGWLPDLPDDLAKIIEEAWASPSRPKSTGWPWWNVKDASSRGKELDEVLSKKPDLDKYIKDFLAKLDPEAVKKFGAHIRNRLCIPRESIWGSEAGFAWDKLVKMSKLQGTEHATIREWAGALKGPSGRDHKSHHLSMSFFLRGAMRHCTTLVDSLICLDAATGKTLWRKDFPVDPETHAKLIDGDWDGKYIDAGEFLGISSTPALSQGKCYFNGAMGLYCLSEKDGSVVWQVKAPFDHRSVLVAGNVVYHFGSAYHAETGALLWKNPLWKGKVTHWEYTSPSLWNSGGKTYILGNNGHNLVCCLDLETGKDLWTLKYNFPYALLDFAVRADSDLLASEGKLYRMTPGALLPLKTFLDVPQMRFGHEQIIVQDHLYQWVTAQEGKKPQVEGLCCFDLKTGDLKWSNKSPTCTWGSSTPSIAADGKIIMAYGSDYVWGNWGIMMIQANPEKFVQVGAFDAGMIPWSNPALAGGALFLRTETGISSYDLKQK